MNFPYSSATTNTVGSAEDYARQIDAQHYENMRYAASAARSVNSPVGGCLAALVARLELVRTRVIQETARVNAIADIVNGEMPASRLTGGDTKISSLEGAVNMLEGDLVALSDATNRLS